MPMVARLATGSITGGSGIAAGAPTRLITTATLIGFPNSHANNPGMFEVVWSYFVTAGGSAGGSAQIPCFTWFDANLGTGVTATGGAFGSLINGGTTSTITGNTSATYGLTGVVSAILRGAEVFQCGSGASGASAYIQVSSLGTGGASTRFDYQIFRVDDWGV